MLWHKIVGSLVASNKIQYIGLASSYGSGSSATCNVPAGAATGDLLIAVSNQQGSTTSLTMTPPLGWVETLDSLGRWAGYLPSWDGTTSNYTFTKSDTSDPLVVMLAFRNAAFDVQGALGSASLTPIAPSITLSQDSSTVLACYLSLSNTVGILSYTTPTDFTEVFDESTSLAVSYKKHVFSGATGDIEVTASGGTQSRGFLIGVKPSVGPIEFISHAFTDSGSTTSFTVAKPTGTQSGDFMLAYFFHHAAGVTLTGPSGWTLLTSDVRSTNSAEIYYQIAGGSEPATYSFSSDDDTANNGAAILTFRNGTGAINVFGNFGTAGTTAISVPSITPTVDGLNIVLVGAENSPQSVTVKPARFTELFQEGVTPLIAAYSDERLVSEGFTGAESFTLQSNAGSKSIQLQIF